MPEVGICALFLMETSKAVEDSDKSGTLNVCKDELSKLDAGLRKSIEDAGRVGVGAIT